mmetsp:Transcript_11649/g.36896  ORF Transcript_11649/g.36896 Transcript_11649/m.36896 type:complete len:200 (+) Transcript_11649:735-1334(+)
MLWSSRKRLVSSDAYSVYPSACSLRNVGAKFSRSRCWMETRMFLPGRLTVDAMSDLTNASFTLGPKAATSPVDAISTPSDGSAPRSRRKENMGDLTALSPGRAPPAACGGSGSCGAPTIARVAASTRFTPIALDAKGDEREARTLHSITSTPPSLTMICMLNGPVISSVAHTRAATSSILTSSAAVRVCGGSISVASPE